MKLDQTTGNVPSEGHCDGPDRSWICSFPRQTLPRTPIFLFTVPAVASDGMDVANVTPVDVPGLSTLIYTLFGFAVLDTMTSMRSNSEPGSVNWTEPMSMGPEGVTLSTLAVHSSGCTNTYKPYSTTPANVSRALPLVVLSTLIVSWLDVGQRP